MLNLKYPDVVQGMWDMLRQMWSQDHGQGHGGCDGSPPVFMYVGDAAGTFCVFMFSD